MTKRIFNHIPDRADQRDFLYAIPFKKFPTLTDWESLFPPIFDQGSLGSCTGNAIVGLREYFMLASGQSLSNLSRLYLYYKERELEGTIGQDSGAMIRDGFKVLLKTGCALEVDYPYVIEKFTEKPSDKAEQGANFFRINAYHRVIGLNNLKAALANKQPVVFGFMVYDSFESEAVSETGLVPLPNTSIENLLGGHCVVAIGYNDTTKLIKVRNSWGADWGDRGHCYMPYSMFNSPIITDMWVGQYSSAVKTEKIKVE